MTNEEYLLESFGPLMKLSDVAGLLGRSSAALRVALYSDTDLSKALKPTMIRLGRRVYFRTTQVNAALQLDDSGDTALQ